MGVEQADIESRFVRQGQGVVDCRCNLRHELRSARGGQRPFADRFGEGAVVPADLARRPRAAC